jgi:kumamolisin
MAGYVPLPGSRRVLLPNSRPAGPVDPSVTSSLTIRVRAARQDGDLAARAYGLYDTALAERRYLSQEELQTDYGASQDDLDAVEHYAQDHNLVVVYRSAAERCVVVKGTLGDLLAAFHADVQLYHHASGTYRGRRGEIKLPEELSGIVTGIFGFDTRPKHRAPHRQKSGFHGGPGGQNGVSAADFAARYKFPTALHGTKLDGKGQTIAIIELGGGYRSSDLHAFFHKIGVALPQVASILVDHGGNRPTTATSADGEVMLDIEVAGAVAPGAKIAVYFAPNTDKGFMDAISAAVHDSERKPSVISISWGSPEAGFSAQAAHAYHEIFAAAALLGITICAASGDHGTADLDGDHWDHEINVDHPACDDLVLGCGGTQINHGVDVVWNDDAPFGPDGGGWASGGGISQLFAVPPYQAKASLPAALRNGHVGRGVPDIAMSATNYFTRVDSDEGPSGGTSAVAPLMAGLIARLNQAKQKNVGFLNPFLYKNAGHGVVKAVTSGTNGIKDTVEGYQAGPGWNACTGLGTPDGTALLKHL